MNCQVILWISEDLTIQLECFDNLFDVDNKTVKYKDNASNLEYMKTLTAECWHSYECIEANGEKYWMYQYVYRMPDEAAAKSLVPTLMYEGSFSNEPDEWSAILTEFEGISEAWEGHANLEYLIRRENTVWYITCDADAGKDHSIDTKLLAANAKK